jgi:hypothetical protein
MIRFYAPPLKEGGRPLFSDLVLDWPRIWLSEYAASAIERLSALADVGLPLAIRARYAAAAAFYETSYANQDWDVPDGFTRG